MTEDEDILKYEFCSRLMDEGKYDQALRHAESILNPGYQAAIFVDAGFALGKAGMVRQGTALFQRLIDSTEETGFARHSLLYNAANGYSSLYSLRRQRRKSIIPPNDKDLRQAKRLYRESLKCLDSQNGEFASQIYVNYGNCLSQLGRFVEAIAYYQAGLKADPTNGMAAGNLGIELEHSTRITGRYTHEYMALAHAMLSQALGESMHLTFGSYRAVQCFKMQHERLTRFLEAHKKLILVPKPTRPISKSKAKKEYLQFCIENGLFLNAWVGDPYLSPGITDEISYGPIITPAGDNYLVPELLRILNEIKEAYTTARYLFFLSRKENRILNDISKMTLYFDNFNFEVNGIYTGLCKSAYVRAFDILDKVARIINVYFGIGKRRDYFWELFAEKQSHGEEHTELFAARPAIALLKNSSLFALADICIDYFEREHVDLTTIDTRRNRITHDYLSLRLYHSNNETEELVDYDNFSRQTLEVLLLAKHALIYAVSAVNLAEAQKESDDKTAEIMIYSSPGQPFM